MTEQEEKMGRRLYVGNIPYDASDEDLLSTFADYGRVASANVITDRETGRSRGFGFVEYEEEASASIVLGLEDLRLGGRSLRISEARERERTPHRPPASGGGGDGKRKRSRRRRRQRDHAEHDW